VNINGLEDIQKSISKLQKKNESLDGTNEIPIGELCTEDFIKRYTEFQSIEEMMSAGGVDFKSEKEFQLETDKSWNRFVSKNSDFCNWESMLEEATSQWVSKKLGS
jgi:hypothetical protein